MNFLTIGEYAAAVKISPQLARLRVIAGLEKGTAVQGDDVIVRGKNTLTFSFVDESKMPEVVTDKPKPCMIPAKFFSDPFNKTGWRTK